LNYENGRLIASNMLLAGVATGPLKPNKRWPEGFFSRLSISEVRVGAWRPKRAYGARLEGV
jgi:hypothetical protein